MGSYPLPQVIRKSSYFLNIPVNIQVHIQKKDNTILWIKGPLGTIRLTVKLPTTFKVEGEYLQWSGIPFSSTRQQKKNIIMNNNLKKQLFNVFNQLISPAVSSFKLVGRGYKVTRSSNSRKIALELGFTNKKVIPLPSYISVRILNRYAFELISLNASSLKTFAKKIRDLRPPNPYTSKGIFLDNEIVTPKQGKATQY
jgi:large subunit ribosomal protein L6